MQLTFYESPQNDKYVEHIEINFKTLHLMYSPIDTDDSDDEASDDDSSDLDDSGDDKNNVATSSSSDSD